MYVLKAKKFNKLRPGGSVLRRVAQRANSRALGRKLLIMQLKPALSLRGRLGYGTGNCLSSAKPLTLLSYLCPMALWSKINGRFVFGTKNKILQICSTSTAQSNADSKDANRRTQSGSSLKKRSCVVFPKQILHTINNQLTIVIGRAALLASEINDAGMKKRCEEIQLAAREISSLLRHIPEGE